MGDYILRTSNISKRYGGLFALKDVSIEIKRGQIYGLIGLNGAGKTTFMRAVMGLLTPTEGKVELFGKTGEADLRKGRARVGQSIENPAIFPEMTAHQNVEIQRLMGGMPDKDSVAKVLSIVGLADTAKKKAKNFSLGMKQRLALAITLVTNPEFLILDEPANGLDPKGIVETRELLTRLANERGITLLVSSHLLSELAQTATHFGIIHKGRLVRQLSAKELADQSRGYFSIVTKQAEQALALLERQFDIKDAQLAAPTEIKVYEHLDKTGEVNTALVKAGFVVEAIRVESQKLEDYFMKIIGGGGQ